MSDLINLTAAGIYPSGGGGFGHGFSLDPDPMGAILTLMPNVNDGAVPVDRSGATGGEKTITAVNGAVLTTATKRYGTAALNLVRASKQHARITPFADFAVGTKVFGFGGDFYPRLDGVREVLFSSGSGPNAYQLARTAAGTVEFRIKGGVSTTPTPAAWPILPSGKTADRYVDAVNGNDSNNGQLPTLAWKTLSKAASTATAGQFVQFADGTYTGSILQTANGTSTNPIVFYAKNRHGAKIVHPASSGRDQGFETRGDYVHTIGFECDGAGYSAGTRWRFGLSCAGTDSHIDYCKVHDISMNTASPSGGGAGILLEFYYNKLGQVANGNVIYRIGPLGGTSSTLHAIYWTGEATMTNNLIYQCVGVGLHGYHSPRDSVCANNTIDGCKYGIYYGWAGAGSSYNGWAGPTDNVRCRNNIIMNCSNQGIFEEGTCTNSVIANNTILNTGGAVSLYSASATGTVTSNPQFVDQTNRNYRLQATSPARNAGLSTEAPAIDYDGYARPQEALYDRGAFEYIAGTAGTADAVYTTTEVMPLGQHTHVWASRDAGNTLTLRLEGKTYLTQAGVTAALAATQALVGIDTAAGTDGFDGVVDGFHFAVDTTVYNADFGPGIGAPPPPTGERRLLFEDDFTTFSGTSTADAWKTRLPWGGATAPGWSNASEYQWYVDVGAGSTLGPNPFSVANSILTITATPTSGLASGKTYTSGVISSHSKFSTTYGYFECRAKLPKGLGFWPAFWLMSEDLDSLPEIDIMEAASRLPNEYAINAHWIDPGPLTATSIGDEEGYVGNFIKNLPDLSAAFHVYGFEWTPTDIVYYFDDREVYRRATPADAGFDQPHYIILNLAVGDGGGWIGPPDGTTQQLQIDWVRVWDTRVATATTFYVAPNGNDAWSGTLAAPNGGLTDGPFLTLPAARDAMRASGAKRCILRGGTYVLPSQFILTTLDNGTIWEAYPGETPVLEGGEALTGFASEGNGLYSKATALTGPDLFIGPSRQRCAQSGVYSPANPYESGWFVAPLDGTATTIRFQTGAVTGADVEEGVYCQSFDRERLADGFTGVASVNTGTTTITLASAVQYPVRAGGTFRLLNRAAYIRNAGEFGWRASDSKLVVRPVNAGTFETDGVRVPRIGRFLTLQGTQGATFKGLTFRHGLYNNQAIRVEQGAVSNTFDGITIDGVGTGMQFSNAHNNVVKNSTIKNCGWWGVYLDAGASGNAIERNTITGIGQVRKDCGAVGGNGVHDTSVRYNDIQGSARYGVSFKDWAANNAHTGNMVEFNVIKDCGFETADMAGIESLGRSNGDTRMSIVGNWIENIRGLATDASGQFLRNYKGFGIYLDDMTNGALVHRNLIRQCAWNCVFIHGGDNNRVESNVCILDAEQEHFLRIEHQPADATNGLPRDNFIRGNVVYASVAVSNYMEFITPGPYTLQRNLVFRIPAQSLDLTADPQFVDPANGNFRLKTNSPALTMPGFVEPPYDLMGLDGVPQPQDGGGGGPGGYPTDKGGFLASGNQILDGAMKPIRFTGANWNGAEWNDSANTGLLPAGLTQRSYQSIMDQFKALGFNLIRLPFADSTVVSTRTTHGYATGPNPGFAGKTPRECIGLMCEYGRQIGVYFLLDHHRNNATTGSGTQVGFLEGDGFTLQNIIDNWKTLVQVPGIFGNPAVFGCDVHNEPNGRAFNWNLWAPKAEQIGNAILSVNPNVMIVVEGNEISFTGGGEEWNWWGGNLEDYPTRPIVLSKPEKLCLSVHEYGPYLVGSMKPWQAAAQFPGNMFGTSGVYDRFFGSLWRNKQHPMLIGEFGAKFEDPSLTKEQQWIEALHKYMNGDLNNTGQLLLGPGEQGMSWTMWTYTPYSGDTGGIMLNDFQTVAQNRYQKYQPHLWPLKGGTITPPPQIRVNGTRI